MAAPVPPTICTALLQPQDRIARVPLGAWARQLRTSMEMILAGPRLVETVSYEIGTVGNNAALVASHQGDTEAAWRLCERQVWWQLRLGRRSNRNAVALHSLQPWVNLGRLEAMAGDWEAALSRLARLDQRRPDGTLALQPLRADGLGCQALRAGTGEFALLVENIFVIDSLKVLLLNHRWEEVLAFGQGLGQRRPGVVLRALEAAVVAASRLGEWNRAHALAQEGIARTGGDPWHRVVFRLRAAEVAACTGEVGRAAADLALLARGVHRLSDAAKAQLQPLYVIMRLAEACREAGCDEDAALLADDVFRGSRAAGDEVFQMEAARLLAETAPPEARAGWRATRDSLRGQTGYRRYRAPGAPAVDTAPLQTLCADLEGLFAA